MKIFKIFLLNCSNTSETQIYLIKHEKDDDFAVLKEKIYKRCPLMRNSSHDPQIYWFDFENDKIHICCDDDFQFFCEESEMTKLYIDFGVSREMSNKRHMEDDEYSESSKKIRRQLEDIYLDESTESSMDLDEIPAQTVPNVTSTNDDEPIPTTSSQNNSKIIIHNVEMIKSAEEMNQNEAACSTAEENNNNEQSKAVQTKTSSKRKDSESNKIVISDSEDDEEIPTKRSFSGGNFTSSSYSFAGGSTGNTGRFHSSFHHNSRSRHFRNNFSEQHAEHMSRIMRNAQAIRANALRNAELLRRNTMNNMGAALLSTFQGHFRPLFRAPNFGHNAQNGRNYRHY